MTRWMAVVSLVSCVTIVSVAEHAAATQILHVSHSPEQISPEAGERVRVRFHLTGAAKRVHLHIYDKLERLVATVATEDSLSTGDQEILWDGRSDGGELVPPEAYHYTIEATASDGETVTWDASDSAGGAVEVSNVAWQPDTGEIRYALAKHARLRIRIGLDGDGPLLHTLLDWVPRQAGGHGERWDGRDRTGALDLSNHPALALDARAFALPRNTIFVGSPTSDGSVIDLPPGTPTRASEPSRDHRMFDYGRQEAGKRRDFAVQIRLPAVLERTREGLPIVRGPVPVRVEVGERDLALALNERSETVFYIDGRFVFERETGFLPITWTWDPKGFTPGRHYFTTNIRGYDGHFGIGTIPIWIGPTDSSH